MTAVGDEAPVPETLEAQYVSERTRLFRALVLTTGNRDIGVEAIDRGFARWQSRLTSRRRRQPETQVFRFAYRWARRRMRSPDRVIQGFRLPPADGHDDADPALAVFDRLTLEDRALLVCRHFLGWTPDLVAAALDVGPAEVEARTDAARLRFAADADLDVEDARAVLSTSLLSRSESLTPPLSRLDSVRARARLRRVGTVVGGVLAGLAFTGGTVLGVQQLLDSSEDVTTPDDSPAVQATEPSTSEPDDPAVGIGLVGAESLVWNRVNLGLREGDISSLAFGPTGFVGIGNDWSRGQGSSLSLLSEDGLEWEIAPGPIQSGDGWVHQMVYAGDRYIAVGSNFDPARGNESPLLAMSSDGLDWVTIDLPTEPSIEIDGQLIDLFTNVQSVATHGDRTIVLGNQHANFDIEPLLREALPDFNFNQGWGWSAAGIQIWSNDGDLQETIPWAEAGISEELAQFISSGRPVAWVSEDFTTWAPTVMKGFGPETWINSLAAIDAGFAATASGQFGQSVWVSTDGENWSPASLENAASISGVASVDGRIIAAGTGGDGTGAVWTSTDLETWDYRQLPVENLGWITRIQVSHVGVSILAQNDGGVNAGPAEVFVDDFRIEATQANTYTIFDADETEIARVFGENVQFEDDLSVTLLDPDSGEALVTIPQADLQNAWNDVWQQFRPVERNPGWSIIYSSDGANWNVIEIGDAVGSSFYPNAVAVGTDAIVMAGWVEGPGFEGDGGGPGIWVGTAD